MPLLLLTQSLLTLASLLFFIANLIIERRTLWIGATFTLASASSLLSLAIFSERYQIKGLIIVSYALIAILTIMLLAGPFILNLTFLYNGIKLIRREGLSLTNSLSLGLAFAIPVYLMTFPFLVSQLALSSLLVWIPTFITLVILYLMSQATLYTLSSLLNLINRPRKNLDYIVVLGSGLRREEVTPLLASRINKAIAIYRKQRQAKLIMSGGQGIDELIPEGQAMADYALKQGVPKEDIIIENQSTTTDENIAFSRKLMTSEDNVAIVTNSYHLFRALLTARQQNLACIGYGARTKFYFSLNAFIREFIAYLVISRRKQTLVLACLLILTLIVYLLTAYISSITISS